MYPSREDTALLLPFAAVAAGEWLLEIGCGAGAVSRAAARAGARVAATDLNPFALAATRRSAEAEGLRVGVVRTDLARGLHRFHRVLCNPPYLPTPPASRDPDPWLNLALDGGVDGLATTRRLLAALPDHLLPGAKAYVVFSSRQPAAARARLADDWRSRGGTQTVAARSELGDETLEVWELGGAGSSA